MEIVVTAAEEVRIILEQDSVDMFFKKNNSPASHKNDLELAELKRIVGGKFNILSCTDKGLECRKVGASLRQWFYVADYMIQRTD